MFLLITNNNCNNLKIINIIYKSINMFYHISKKNKKVEFEVYNNEINNQNNKQ